MGAGRARVLCCVHQADAGPGVFAEAATRSGVELVPWLVPDEPVPTLDGLAGLVVLGASADVDQQDDHPWLTAEKTLIRSALTRQLPLLGVCLGSQLLAEAGGAKVRRLEVSEIGWKTIDARAGTERDPLFAELENPAVVFQWHRCTFAVPPGSELLAENDVGPQAFRLGQAWGVQFHPEVTAAIIGGWIDDDGTGPEARGAGVQAQSLRRETAARISASMNLGRGLFERFLAFASRA
ncbi:MAG: type 1 glutamine amidotransferase [Solirubrobacteraceae bacterium]